MIHILGKIPNRVFIACSGGVDSMVALDFLLNGRYKPIVINFNHSTEFGNKAAQFLKERCKELGVQFLIQKIERERNKKESVEEYWRTERYKFFDSIPGEIVMAHHLDDAVEWWIFSSLHGNGRLIPYRRNNVIRPFLLTKKSEIVSWADRKGVKYLDDPGNTDEKYMRTIVRHKIMPQALKVNPGLHSVVRKNLKKEYITQ